MFEFLGSYQYFTDVLLIDLLLVLSLYVVFRCGLLSLASVGLMAIGGYTTALLVMKAGWPVAAGIALAPLVGGFVAYLFGVPVLRLEGIYLALGSLALAQAAVIGIANFEFTNGARGFAGIPRSVSTEVIVGALVVVLVALQLVHRSHWGRAMRAIRLDEGTAEGLGINIHRYKTVAFAASGVLAGLAGALEAHTTGVVTPQQYSFGLLVIILTYMIVGGSGHWIGVVAATLAIGVFRETIGFAGTTVENMIFGVLLIVVMLVAPHGLSDVALYRSVKQLLRRLQGREPVQIALDEQAQKTGAAK